MVTNGLSLPAASVFIDKLVSLEESCADEELVVSVAKVVEIAEVESSEEVLVVFGVDCVVGEVEPVVAEVKELVVSVDEVAAATLLLPTKSTLVCVEEVLTGVSVA